VPKFPAGKVPKKKLAQHRALHAKAVKHEHGTKVHAGKKKKTRR
jgi:hypothetical protein